jgi:hypothetical protein
MYIVQYDIDYLIGLGLWCLTPFSTIFQLVVSFIGRENHWPATSN